MGFWSRLFWLLGGGEPPAQEPAAAPGAKPVPPPPQAPAPAPMFAPGTRIAYDAGLIPHLLADHRRLVTLFTEIRGTFVAGDAERAGLLLGQFKSDVQAHLLTEEVRLYIYLQNALTSDKLNHSLMRHMHHEMSMISNDVLDFLGKYDALDKVSTLRDSFLADLDKVGVVLTERIQREESLLYPLYMPPVDMEKMQIRPPR